jgi:glycosyltransferase involved in cell wall biosynthesis
MDSQNSRAARVGICIATFRRPDGLRELLKALAGLSFPDRPAPGVVVVVADNDPESGEAVRVCEEFAHGTWPVMYTSEPRQGISYARNTAVAVAIGWGAELIAFVDDDEIPAPCWLDELLRLFESSGADVVAGPVLPEFEGPVPGWVVKGRFFERPRYPTGTLITEMRAGNLLIRGGALDKNGQMFDERFALTGGEDSYLNAQLRQSDSKMVWADEAVVVERVPRSRATAGWILRRAFAGGCNWGRVELLVDPGLMTFCLSAARGLAHIVIGSVTVIPSLFAGRHAVVRCGIRVWAGLGLTFGLFGYRSERYRAHPLRSEQQFDRPALRIPSGNG